MLRPCLDGRGHTKYSICTTLAPPECKHASWDTAAALRRGAGNSLLLCSSGQGRSIGSDDDFPHYRMGRGHQMANTWYSSVGIGKTRKQCLIFLTPFTFTLDRVQSYSIDGSLKAVLRATMLL